MAIANDMLIAVSSEENQSGATEFYVHNVVSVASDWFRIGL